jgi:hypothetical protein
VFEHSVVSSPSFTLTNNYDPNPFPCHLPSFLRSKWWLTSTSGIQMYQYHM